MSLLFETISIRHGKPEHLSWHQRRLEASFRAVFGSDCPFSMEAVIQVPAEAMLGHFRCRVDYDTEVRSIVFMPYMVQRVESLKLTENNEIDYSHKFAGRSALDALFAGRGCCDDVLIIRNGLITDTSYANVALMKEGRWYTPLQPLLAGTCRSRLLKEGKLIPAHIRPEDLHYFEHILLINALRGFQPGSAFPVSRIE